MTTDNLTTLPVNDVTDVLKVLPSVMRPDDAAEVRDAMLAGAMAMFLAIQDAGEYAASQADMLRATGVYEDDIGSERGAIRNSDTNEVYRTRILSPPAVVTPVAIIADANSVLAPFTSVQALYFEGWGDRAFFFDASQGVGAGPSYNGAPLCYFYDDNTIPRSPDYPDRLYSSEGAENGGFAIPNREPGAARFFDDVIGRLFILRVPDLSPLDAQDTPVYNELQPNDFYVGTATANSITSYVHSAGSLSAQIYANIVNSVERIRGQSIRWMMFVGNV